MARRRLDPASRAFRAAALLATESSAAARWPRDRWTHVWLGSDRVHLRWRVGANELVLAVTDDQRFGWGFAARLPAGSVAVGEPE